MRKLLYSLIVVNSILFCSCSQNTNKINEPTTDGISNTVWVSDNSNVGRKFEFADATLKLYEENYSTGKIIILTGPYTYKNSVVSFSFESFSWPYGQDITTEDVGKALASHSSTTATISGDILIYESRKYTKRK